jgi:hypothetical protein
MKNLEVKEGYKNRHLDGLPDTEVFMKIIHSGQDGVILCKWFPGKKRITDRSKVMGTAPYFTTLGTARSFDGIGYHAWEDNNDEFTYYSVIDLV